MGERRLLAAALTLNALLTTNALAQSSHRPLIEQQEITITAEEMSYEQRSNTIVAQGDVIITRGETVLRADEVRLNRLTNEADAQGHVRLTDSEGTIVAEALHLNLDEETGTLHDAHIQSRRMQYSLSGARVEKGLGQTYHIENGQFTTCHCSEGPPSWSIGGRDLAVTLGGYGRLVGGTFKVLDVPVLYLPRAMFPVQRERQSGLLLPRFGVSNRRGFQMLLPVYWAISKSQDATFGLDLETSVRAGVVGEYRYAFSRETRGFLDASYFNESFRGAAPGTPFQATIPENRWSVTAGHEQPFLGSSRLYTDVFLVSDDLFLRDINTYAFEHSHEVAVRTLPFTQTHLAAVQLWDRAAIKGEGTYYQDLTGFKSQTLQRAPEIDLWSQTMLGQTILGEFSASAVDFQRARSVDGVRLDIEPAAVAPLPLGRLAFGSVRASLRETAYHLTDTRLSDTGQELRTNPTRELFQLEADLGTSLSRIYPATWFGLEKIKHTVEPTVEYLYIPAVSQNDLPLFDGIDRINHRNLITYGLVNRFLGKFSADPSPTSGQAAAADTHAQIRELGRLTVMQSFDISREISSLQPGRAADHFSDIQIDARANPSRALSLRLHMDYDVATTNVSAAHFGIFLEDPRPTHANSQFQTFQSRSSVGLFYRFQAPNQLQELDPRVVLRLTNWAAFSYSSRYDIVANRFLDNFFALTLLSTCDCWSFDIGVTNKTNPQEVEVRAQLTLVGVGSSGPATRAPAAP